MKKNYWVILQVIVLIFMINGCKQAKECEAKGGRLVDCYKQKGDNFSFANNLCTATDIPPCGECWVYHEDLDSNVDPWQEVSGLFVSETCTDEFGNNTGLPPIEVDQPYIFDCSSSLCTQYSTYYFDMQPNSATPDNTSYDGTYRPIYLKFNISNFNLGGEDYFINVYETNVFAVPIFSITLSVDSSPEIRFLNPASCSSTSTNGCSTEGVVKLDLNNSIKNAGTYYIKMTSENNTMVEKTTTFDVKITDENLNYQSNQRKLDILNYGNGTFNLSDYSIDGRNLTSTSNSILDWVLGQGTSNIETSVTNATKDIRTLKNSYGYPFVGTDGQIMLDVKLFSVGTKAEDFLRVDLAPAIRSWAKELNNNAKLSYGSSYGIITELNGIGAYDFDQIPPARETYYDADLNLYLDWGFTAQDYLDGDYNIVIVWAHNIDKDPDVKSLLLSTSINLSVALHEIGHMWSTGVVDDTALGDEAYHNSFCKGTGKGLCLFQNSAIATAANQSGDLTNMYEFLNTISTTPFYCEGHQQILINQLIPR